MPEVRCVVPTGDWTGEGATWHAGEQALYWVDINRRLIHRLDIATTAVRTWFFDEPPTALGLTDRADTLVVALGGRLILWQPANDARGEFAAPEKNWPSARLNDGRPDPAGHFWVGSMFNNVKVDGTGAQITANIGRLFRVTRDGATTVEKSDIGISNTFCWSPDNTRFYSADTLANAISVWDYDIRTGTIANERPFFTGFDRGSPDGSAMDSQGYLWNARYGGGCVVRIAPDGSIDRIVELPAHAVTTCTFGGPQLKTMYITTAGGGEGASRAERLAGSLFALDVEVPGLPENHFRLAAERLPDFRHSGVIQSAAGNTEARLSGNAAMFSVMRCLGAAVLAAAVFAGAAHAETRLFSVKTDQPSVTVVQAVRSGKALAVAGQNAGATFFRIDNPAGAVPCANRITFTTSNGKVIDGPVDLCATNWELTLALVGGTTGGATTTSTGTAGTATTTAAAAVPPRNATQPVAIVTDDPNVRITNVFLRGQEVPIAARQDPYVQINLLGGPQGFECTRDLGLALSDGRRIARLVDVCASNFVVVVALVGGPRPPAPPSNFRPPAVIQPLPPQTQPLPPQVQLPEPPPSTGPEIVTNMQWMFAASNNRASFAYGIPETDASEFTAVCQQRSSKITITLTRSADELGPGGNVPVTFAAGTFSKTYAAKGSEVSELDGISHPVLQLSVADPLWASMIKERILQITIGANSYGLSLSGSATKAKQFLVACSPAPPPPPPPPPVTQDPGGSNSVSFACDDGSYLNVAFDATTAVVYESGVQPIVLLAQPYQGGQRWVAGQSQLIGQGEQIYWMNQGYTRTCTRG